jgi:hypothetical protein
MHGFVAQIFTSIQMHSSSDSPYEASFSSCEELSFSKETSSHQNANVRSGTIRNIMLLQQAEGHWERVAIGEVSGR